MGHIDRPFTAVNDFPREFLENQRPDASHKVSTFEVPEDEISPEAVIVCRQCRKNITDPTQRFSVDGSHHHTFANPHGLIFDIGCFQSAIGCRRIGPVSDEFTWFKGYHWQIVVCAGCMVHLGWFFLEPGGQHYFYGLILDRLINPS